MTNSINPYLNTRIEYHIIQSFPVTCLNRDDVGAPKTAQIGGATRSRVSSQCWKRPTRFALQDLGITLGVRTKKTQEVLESACRDAGADEEQAKACGEIMVKRLADDTLLFLSASEAAAFADFAKENDFDLTKLKDLKLTSELEKISKKALNPAVDALDIALFGRMVAKAPSMKVEAAASFSHAISTHRVSNEIDFFTALDDMDGENGSAHMGSLEFNSATYYRYISLDLGELYKHLGDNPENMRGAIDAFTKALFIAVPSARQNTQSGASPWDFARVMVRKGQRLQASFDQPIKASAQGGYSKPSIDALKTQLDEKEALFGSLFGKIASYDWGEDSGFSIDSLTDALKQLIKD